MFSKPPAIKTSASRSASSYSPLGRLGAPDDVAGVAHFLATDDAAYLTGQAFNVTGGMIMH